MTSAGVDRELCAALWSTRRFSRNLAAGPASALRRNAVADDTVLDRLQRWIDAIEVFAVRMMSGFELPHCAFDIVERLASGDAQRPHHFSFLLPVTREMLRDEDLDVRQTAEKALLFLRPREA